VTFEYEFECLSIAATVKRGAGKAIQAIQTLEPLDMPGWMRMPKAS
jgi:hypothetical protein